MFFSHTNNNNTRTSQKFIHRPFLFSIEKNNKTSYLFGTTHGIGYHEIPQTCVDIIRSCSDCVVESSGDADTDENFITEAILRTSEDKPWHTELPNLVFQFLKKCVEKFYASGDPEYARPVESLKLWAALELADQGLTLLGLEIENNSTEVKVMDFGIMENFEPSHIHCIEDQAELIGVHYNTNATIDDILKWYKKSAPLLGEGTSDESQKIKQKDEEDCDSYRTGNLLNNQEVLDDINQDTSITTRNQTWLPRIEKHHKDCEGSVFFALGAGHLIGNNGLLTLLPNNGFKLKSFENGVFVDFIPRSPSPSRK
jgi:hypothetical protein